MEFPGSLRPLTQLWRQQQLLQITLFDEKARYQHLQESSDSQIDSLRQSGRVCNRSCRTPRASWRT